MAAATIAKVTVAVAVPAVAPVAVTVSVADQAADGVPEMTPVDGFITKPVGRVPEVTAYDTEPVKSLAVNATDGVIAVPAVPEIVWVDGEMEAATIAKVTVAVAVPAVAPVAVIVTVADEAADGVPEITPVDGLNDKPAGNEPDVTAYDTKPEKFVSVNDEELVIDVPTVPDTD